MVTSKIWLGAQAINAVVSAYFYKDLVIFIVPFALLCGSPAALVFYVWISISKNGHIAPNKLITYSLLVFSLATLLSVIALMILIDSTSSYHHGVFAEVAYTSAIPVISTIVSTLLFRKQLLKEVLSNKNSHS